MKKTAYVDIPVSALEPASRSPLHIQVYDRIRKAILTGVLRSGARLPSTRALADELAVSRTTVISAYEQLVAEGYLESRVGAGTRVAAEVPERLLNVSAPNAGKRRELFGGGERAISQRGQDVSHYRFGPDLRIANRSWRFPFRVAVPALDAFPFEIWSKLVMRHGRRSTREMTDYQDGRGLKRLRVTIAGHLSVSRGIRCTADQVLITAGAQSAIDLSVRLLLDPGDRALIEDPSHLGIHGALKGGGADIIAVPVDQEGLVLSQALQSGARLAFVTPSNQFPLAVTMSLPRRLALLDWAARTNAWILEDDYDSEFRFIGRPLEALQALDRGGRVLYIGSFSKVLFPGIRLGYLVVPPDLADAFASARRFVDIHPPVLFQAVLADFIEEGHFGRHLRRMRVLYCERGQAMKSAVDRLLGGAIAMAEPQAGMHAVAWLPAGLDDREVSAAAARKGVEARALSAYSIREVGPGLVLGFSTVSPREISDGARKLARAFESVERDSRSKSR